MQYVRTEAFDGTTYSNGPYGIYLLTGQVAKQSPRRYFYASSLPTDDLVQLDRNLQVQGVVRLVWFTDYTQDHPHLYSPADLAAAGRALHETTRLDDGTVYLVSSQP
jgi:hypothetical protein